MPSPPLRADWGKHCERNADFFVAVAVSTEPVQLPAGSVLLGAVPLAEEGRLQPNNAVWGLRD